MAQPQRGFEPVLVPDEPTPEPAPPRGAAFASNAIALALKALSQRAVAATRDVFTLLSVTSAWWLWWSIPDPSPTQIVSLSIYAGFVLAANVIVRRI